MIGPGLFRRYAALAAFLVLALLLLGTFATQVMLRLMPYEHARPLPHLVARVIQNLDPKDPVHALEILRKWYPELQPDLVILDEKGGSLTPGKVFPYSLDELARLSPAHDALWVDRDRDGPPDEALILLSEEPKRYLYVKLRPLQARPPLIVNLASVAFQLLAVLLGMGTALYFLYRSLRDKGDEIDRLVERLRATDRSRMSLLQELAHDLRTPIASLKNLVATLSKRSGDGERERATRTELLALAGREVDYFEELVEDLLVLAQISEPRYEATREPVSLIDLLEEEVEAFSARCEGQGKEIRIQRASEPGDLQLTGDPRLLHRMIRNALDNAVSFAQHEVVIKIEAPDEEEILLSVEDDGPGMTDAAIRAFGERRVSRILGGTSEGRLSVGLGSVIMKTIAQLHRGTLQARNRSDRTGARIEIRLPVTAS